MTRKKFIILILITLLIGWQLISKQRKIDKFKELAEKNQVIMDEQGIVMDEYGKVLADQNREIIKQRKEIDKLKSVECPVFQECKERWEIGDCNTEINRINELNMEISRMERQKNNSQRGLNTCIEKCKPTCSYLNGIEF